MPGRDYALTMKQVRRVVELYRDGHSERDIARVFNVSRFPIRTALRLMGESERPRLAAIQPAMDRWKQRRRAVSSVFHL